MQPRQLACSAGLFYRNHRNGIEYIMRISLIISFIIGVTTQLLMAGTGYGQGNEQTLISLKFSNAPIKKIFAEIEEKANVVIMYENTEDIMKMRISISATNIKVADALNQILKGKLVEWTVRHNVIRLSHKPEGSNLLNAANNNNAGGETAMALFYSISGRVVDSAGMPIAGATWSIKGSNTRGSADNDGRFVLNDPKRSESIVLSSVGFATMTIAVSQLMNTSAGETIVLGTGKILKRSPNEFTFFLKHQEKDLDEVVISTGMFDRKKETFTGVTRTFTGKELRAASRLNVLEGLNMLDPSFKIIRDNNLGSDPNQVPKVEMRGSRSIPPPTPVPYSQQLKLQYEQDPNQPLFILDGFESSLSAIVNLDINRIASITLLKDAASTALYGSRSANGVVVVETIRPEPGKLRVSYAANASFIMPDLHGYNMMNASELLEFQKLASQGVGAPGPFADDGRGGNIIVPKLKQTYRANAIINGVNSNWLEAPLQNATTLQHSLSVAGGDSYFSYNLGFSKGTVAGVMKGSKNSTAAGHASLAYRKGKLNVSNYLLINNQKQEASRYGSFKEYVKIPPYYTINTTDRYLEEHYAEYYSNSNLMTGQYQFANPLYNAHLPFKNQVEGLTISNNLAANWDVLPVLRLSGGLRYSRSNRQSDYFVSPLNTKFDVAQAGLKGTYDFNQSSDENIGGYVTGTFNKVFANKHIVNMNVRGDVGKLTQNGQSVSAIGFATTAEPLLYLANSFLPDGRPGGSTSSSNTLALTGSLNYSYDMRYNLDVSYNLSGTSNFGSDNPYQSFYSLGVGWNIGKEAFLRNSRIVNQLNLSANLGLTGNQNAGNFGSRSTYQLNNNPSFFGEAFQLQGLGNPNLDWTKTYNVSYSLSGRFFNNVLSLSFAGYRNLTDPLIVNMPLPPSVGLPEGLPKNIGKLTSIGLELIIDARVVQNKDWTVNIGFNSPLLYKSKYSRLGNLLEKYNDSARNNGYMQRYFDGSSPDDVWAVRSLGIGQAKGLEVFLDKEGRYTHVYNKNYEVAIGSSRPITQGNMNIRARYKKFTIGIYARYVVEEMKFNNALYNRVENISPQEMEFNQDKRALYVRWKQPGDDASFLGITKSTIGMSSRFLQKENALFIDGINFNYDLINQFSSGFKSRLRQRLGLQALGFGITTSNIFQFRLSNIKVERGLDYPFQRNISANMNLTF